MPSRHANARELHISSPRESHRREVSKGFLAVDSSQQSNDTLPPTGSIQRISYSVRENLKGKEAQALETHVFCTFTL